MQEPTLLIMAAGIGSRFGGLKQTETVGSSGQFLMDYSVYDALQAGFKKVTFVIKKEMQELFDEKIGTRISAFAETAYCYQTLQDIPEGEALPSGREKPWGTGHAVFSARHTINGPFAVINADDYYGKDAFRLMYNRLTTTVDNAHYQYSMVGYKLSNTLTENGSVSRGICQTDANGKLLSVTEHTRIEKQGGKAVSLTAEGECKEELPMCATVSMNMWGFTESFFTETGKAFETFFKQQVPQNPLKAEFYLPSVVSGLISTGKADVQVMQSEDSWYGITYKEDMRQVKSALRQMHEDGLYPKEMLGLK